MMKTNMATTTSFPYENFDCSLKNCKDYVFENGVAVVPDVLSQEEVKKARGKMFILLTEMLKNSEKPFKWNETDTWVSYFELIPLYGMLLHYFKVGQS
jgi:hypothetical protein